MKQKITYKQLNELSPEASLIYFEKWPMTGKDKIYLVNIGEMIEYIIEHMKDVIITGNLSKVEIHPNDMNKTKWSISLHSDKFVSKSSLKPGVYEAFQKSITSDKEMCNILWNYTKILLEANAR